MKKMLFIALLGIISLTVAACSNQEQPDIVTTMFPQYDFARQIVGDKMSVALLTPPGVGPHEFEASSQDMVTIQNAKLFIFTSLELDTWVSDPATIGGEDTIVLNLSEHYKLAEDEHHHEDDHVDVGTNQLLSQSDLDAEDDDHDHDHDDELHYWTDPTTAIQMIEAILEQVIAIDPDNTLYYEENAHDYIHEIEEVHDAMALYFEDEAHHDHTFYFAGHNALGALANRYHFTIISLFPDFKPDQDLTSAQLVTFINEIKANQVTHLFIEELVEPRAAQTIVDELAQENYTLTLLELHGYHNITKAQMDDGISYLDLLICNFEYLRLVLESGLS